MNSLKSSKLSVMQFVPKVFKEWVDAVYQILDLYLDNCILDLRTVSV